MCAQGRQHDRGSLSETPSRFIRSRITVQSKWAHTGFATLRTVKMNAGRSDLCTSGKKKMANGKYPGPLVTPINVRA